MSKEDYKQYLEADYTANGFTSWIHNFNVLKRYIRRLRYTEYLVNCNKSRFRILCSRFLLNKISIKTGITIGINCFGKGLYIPHYGYIVCNGSARFGDNCIVQCGVNISENASGGDYIYFGTGAKIMKNTFIPSYSIIGANAVITKKFKQENTVIAGIPGKVISENGMKTREKQI